MPLIAQRSWETGVVSSLPPDKLPDTSFALGGNTAFAATPGGTAAIELRPGLRRVGRTSSSPAQTVRAILPFTHLENAGTTNYVLGILGDGTLWSFAAVTAEITRSADLTAAFLGSGWKGVVANNRVYAVGGSGGTERFKVYRQVGVSTLYTGLIGLPRPAAPTLNELIAGDMTGSYEFAVTWYNEHTGTESSRSDGYTAATLSNNAITLNVPASIPAEASHWRVHMRHAPGVDFYQVAERTRNQTTATINTADTTLLFTLSPDRAENDPPPAKLRTLCWHLNRMFYTDGHGLYFSKLGNPEQVDPENELQVGENDNAGAVMALWSLSDSSMLILKERAAYVLVGNSPQNWEIRLVSQSFGSVTAHVAEGDGYVAWWSAQGPVVWNKQTPPQSIGSVTIEPLVAQGCLALATRDGAYHLAFDPNQHRFLFALPTTGAASHWTVAPWSTLHQSWEATGWDLPPVSAFAVGRSLTTPSEFRVFLGSTDHTVWEVARDVATDAAANETGARLVHPIASQASLSQVVVIEATDQGALPVNPTRSRCSVIDGATLQVHRREYTVSRTGAEHTITFGTALPATLGANSRICFDVPVLELDSKVWGTTLATTRLIECGLEVEAIADTPIYWGVLRDSTRTPFRAWHEQSEQTTDLPFDTFTPAELTPTVRELLRRVAGVCRRWSLRVVGYAPRPKWQLTTLLTTFEIRRS